MASLHLIKLSVGSETIADLARWQASQPAQGPDGLPRHVTRMWPKRAEELLQGGSIYWVIRGVVQCRQIILRLDEVIDPKRGRSCGIILDPVLYPTVEAAKRPFQGWRYLEATDAPADLGNRRKDDTPLPPHMAQGLAEIGVL